MFIFSIAKLFFFFAGSGILMKAMRATLYKIVVFESESGKESLDPNPYPNPKKIFRIQNTGNQGYYGGKFYTSTGEIVK
jgi:hypothetical protein